MAPSIVSLIEDENGHQLKINLPKEVTVLWTQLREVIPQSDLPRYKKNEMLGVIDHAIHQRAIDHIVGLESL